MHHPDFQKLEGTWRGLHYLVMNSETSAHAQDQGAERLQERTLQGPGQGRRVRPEPDLQEAVRERVRHARRRALRRPDRRLRVHQPSRRTSTFWARCRTWRRRPSARSSRPPRPKLFGFENWTELAKPRDLEKIFDTVEYTKWKSFRDSEDSRFVTLVMPRVLSRLPYGADTKPIEEFDYEEVELDSKGKAKPVPHEHYYLDERGLRAWARG